MTSNGKRHGRMITLVVQRMASEKSMVVTKRERFKITQHFCSRMFLPSVYVFEYVFEYVAV